VTWAGLLAGATGCTSDDAGGIAGAFGAPPAPEDVIKVSPGDGSRGVRPGKKLRVRVPDGRLEKVKVVRSQDAQESPVPGHLSADGLTWEPDEERLALAAKYTIDAVAVDGDGRRSARHTTFTTYVPEERFIGYVAPENRATVGIGMIVSLEFNREIANRAAVERAVRVTARPAVEIRPHWFGKTRLDFRPEDYWKPGTQVTVALRLRDVEGAPGVYGLQHKTFSFTVGRSQVSVVDAAAHSMEVRRDGEPLATVPVTAGAPKNTTYNGKMVVTEMLDVTRMNGATVGFKKRDGESDYDTPAGWFFDRSLIGDVVEVVNSNDKKVSPDNGLGGWNMSWNAWKAGTAVK
jgi:hypothetical protein